MRAARWLMATVLRPLGEVLARLPAFEEGDGRRGGGAGGSGRPTAGMCFEQYGEFRVPAQPDARAAATVDELDSIAADLEVVAAEPDLSAPWAGARLSAVAADVRMIRERFLGRVPPPAKNRFEPAAAGRWLSVDFEGWYQVRLATGGDPYNDPRGVSGWQFALPGEPDMDRVLRFQPEGTFLRPHIDPGITVGVTVTSAGPLAALTGARVELLGEPRFEGHNGAVAADGDEPIVPCRLRISADGVVLQRDAADTYQLPYVDVASLGGFGDLPAARALRVSHGLPEQVFGPEGLTPEMRDHLLAARDRIVAAISDAQAAGDEDAALVLTRRRLELGRPAWPFGAIVAWRFPLQGSDVVVEVPAGVPAPATDAPWWLELLSTGFDPDAGCALIRGVLHAPIGSNPGPPPWQIALESPEVEATTRSMPVDAMDVRLGR